MIKAGSGSSKRYVDSRRFVNVIDKQGDAIRRLIQTIYSASNQKKLTSTAINDMGKDVHNIEQKMEYYASKLHQVDQRIEVSICNNLPHT